MGREQEPPAGNPGFTLLKDAGAQFVRVMSRRRASQADARARGPVCARHHRPGTATASGQMECEKSAGLRSFSL